jgi:hypothetical protein
VQTALSRKCKKTGVWRFYRHGLFGVSQFRTVEDDHQSIGLNDVLQHRSRPFCGLGIFKLTLAQGIHFSSRLDFDSGENETGMKAIMTTRTDFTNSDTHLRRALLMHAKHPHGKT